MPVRYILSSMRVRLNILSHLSVIQYIGLCVFSLPIPLWWLREYTLCLIITTKSEVWTSIHCLGLGHETMISAICLYPFSFIPFYNKPDNLTEKYSVSGGWKRHDIQVTSLWYKAIMVYMIFEAPNKLYHTYKILNARLRQLLYSPHGWFCFVYVTIDIRTELSRNTKCHILINIILCV